VTVNVAVSVLPLLSVAEQVTRVLPSLKRLPDRGLHVTDSEPSTLSSHVPAPSRQVFLGHLAFRGGAARRCPRMLRRKDAPLDRETVDGIIRMLMDINAKLDRLLGEPEDDDAAEDES